MSRPRKHPQGHGRAARELAERTGRGVAQPAPLRANAYFHRRGGAVLKQRPRGVRAWYRKPITQAAKAPPAAPYGGGDGQVWTNNDTMVCLCSGGPVVRQDQGGGAYMTEASALAEGYHADHGNACQPQRAGEPRH